jgi:gamma-glutamyltranspeptidase/glutathione hydrolase
MVTDHGTMPAVSRHAAVAAPNQQAVDAALSVAGAGGNAVDAALAAMFVAASTEPGMVSLGGGGFVSVWPADGDPEIVDGNSEMPGRGLPDERFGGGLREIETSYGGGLVLHAGPGSVATPGTLAALGLAHTRHGRAPWATVLEPAIHACRNGFPIGAAAATYLGIVGHSVFGWDPDTAKQVIHPDGTMMKAGDRASNPDLADTLEAIIDHGSRWIYTGDLGTRLAEDQQARGGLITLADLAAYQPIPREPAMLTLGGWQIALNPPPSVGGPMLAVMLNELVRRGSTWQDVIDIQRQVLTYRFEVHDLSTDLEQDGIDLLAALPTSASTAHVSVVDREGNACAITCSSGYGSGATIPGTGVMLNNSLGEPELNRLGLHVLAPGTRLASNMAPTVARGPNGRVLAIGSPGADRITTALMQVLARYCLMERSLQESIEAPRLHVRVLEDGSARVDHEDDAEVSAAAVASGLPTYDHGPASMFFGGVGAALLGPDGLHAVGDPRRESATGVC